MFPSACTVVVDSKSAQRRYLRLPHQRLFGSKSSMQTRGTPLVMYAFPKYDSISLKQTDTLDTKP